MAYVRPPTWNDGDVVYAADLENVYDGVDSKAPTIHSHASTQITDATVTGRALITAATATAARTAISAAPALGSDDNYVTDAEKAALHSHANKTALDQVSGINTGDQVLPTWSTIDGKPAVVAAGATQADARAAIGAGTSSLVIGTTAGTAKAGDYAPDLSGYLTSATAATTYVAQADLTVTTGASVSGDNTGDQDLSGYATITQTINAQTGTTYTLVASDAGKLVTCTNAAAITVTVPDATFTAGQRVDILVLGAGMVTVAAGSGVTLDGTPSLVSRAQYSALTVLFLTASSAVVVGDTATP